MASRSGLYTHFRRSRVHQSEERIRRIHLISFDVHFDRFLMINEQYQIKIFSEEEVDCWFDYMTSGIDEIYLFISNIISNTHLQSICEYPQIKSFYILCKDPEYQNYPDSTHKLRGIFHHFDSMYKQFQDDIIELKNEHYFEQITFQHINKEKSGQILWWKFFDQIVQHIQQSNIAKEEFLAFFRENFRDDERALREIQEFEGNYTSDKAIYWYTRSDFLYKLLNQTLRTQNNLNNIFKLQLFLTDLIAGLKGIHSISDRRTDPLITYRGQTMKLEEIDRLKSAVGNTICFNQFVSTTIKRDIAQAFADVPLDDCFNHHVLFIIQIDSLDLNSNTTPFANISNYSAFQHEEELLFSMHLVFLVQSVQLVADHFYHIQLKLVNNQWNDDINGRSIFSPHIDQIFIQNSSKKNKQMIGFQLLLDMILRLDQTEYAKKELIAFSRLKYKDNPIELKKIDDFERDYQSEDAARWYYKDSFLYRLLNDSLHIEPIDCIVKMRYFIQDLYHQLNRLQPSFIQSLNGQKNLILYRGRTMKINQLNQLRESIGSFISMNGFLSATQDKQVAILFSSHGKTTNPDEISVIYEMCINTNTQSIPFAKIESVIKDEEEILFFMGSIFHITDVYELGDRMYAVKLTMEHIEDQLWENLTAHLN